MKSKTSNFIIVTADHGGFRSGYCAVCGVRGWIDFTDDFKHKKGCPIDTEDEYVSVVKHKG